MRLNSWLTALGLTLWSATLVSAAESTNVFESRESGFRISKPADWQFLPTKTVVENLALPRLRSKELEKQIRSKPNVPFLVMARFTEPYVGINPSVQVSLKTQGELLGQGAAALLGRIAERLKGNFRDLTFVEPVTETTLDAQPAARMLATYTVTDAQAKEFKTLARMWVVPQGDYMFTISMYAPTEGATAFEKQFEEILNSIHFTKK